MPVRSFNEANPPDDRACVRIETVSRSESNLRVQISVFRRISFRALIRAILALVLSALASAEAVWAAESHAIAMHGAPAQPADFTHMAYVNPDAPSGHTATARDPVTRVREASAVLTELWTLAITVANAFSQWKLMRRHLLGGGLRRQSGGK